MNNKARTGRAISSVAALCFLTACAVSAVDSVIVPVGVTASSYYPAYGEPVSMINGSGLTGTGRLATHTPANQEYLFWHSNGQGVAGQWVEFDLGAAYDVSNALVWQLAQQNLTSRGVRSFTISVAGEDHVLATYSADNTLNIATGTSQEPVQVFPLVARDVRHVRLTIQSNYGDQYVGLSEVRFEGVPAAPLIVPVGAKASSNYGAQPYNYGPQWLIDGSGLTGSGPRASHSNANNTNLFWHSNTDIDVAAQWVEFDLGATYRVTNALIWQLAQQNLTSRGVHEFTISVADPSHNFSTYSTGNTLNIATGNPQEPAQQVPLVAENTRYVRFSIQSNWGAWGIVGLSEVRFDGTPSVSTPRELVWNGTSGDATWNTTAQNWLADGSATAFATGDNVRFDDTAAEKSVTFSNNVAAAAIVVDSTGTYRLSAGAAAEGRIYGTDSFVKRGSGTLILDGGTVEIPDSFHAFSSDLDILEGTVIAGSGSVVKNATSGPLGNMQAARTIRVSTNATLSLPGQSVSGAFQSTPATAVVVDHGTLSLSSAGACWHALGPLTLNSAKVECENVSGYTDIAFNGLTRFMGTSTVHFAQTGYGKSAYFLNPAGTELCVSNITHDAAWDVRFDWTIRDSGVASGFRKTGSGTLYLGNRFNTFSGDITVSEGTLELEDGNGTPGATVNVLGNPQVARKVRVENGATLKFNGSNTITTGFDSPVEELEIVGGTLLLPNGGSNVFGPLTLDDATVTYNIGYGADWAMMIFSKRVTFKGTQPYVFSPAGANSIFACGLNEETEMNVWDITGSPATDVALNLPCVNFDGVLPDKPGSRFKKTGAGTLSLGAVNTSTGALRVVEGVLRIDGQWSGLNASVAAESGGYLGGTGQVARAVFAGGGFECAAGQAGQLAAGTVSVGATGTVRILNPAGLPITQVSVPFMSYATIENAGNLANWTVEVEGCPPSTSLRVRALGGQLVAGWAPRGTLLQMF